MEPKKRFYITTTLPYVNSDPHIGFGMEIVRADVIARWKKLCGYDVFFNTGTDEHGQKIWQKAEEAGTQVQAYVDGYAEKFKELIPLLGISSDIRFIRTTDEKHVKAAQEFWKRCNDNGDIYKKLYEVKYCVGCELEKTESELVEGKCAIHPHLELELRKEENYFFRFSKYQESLLELYEKNPHFVRPDFRFNEIKAFVKRGLEDFSISRLKEKMPWGVPVPGDADHVMYVWFDALVSYISTLDWPGEQSFDRYWKEGTPVQYAGKDNLRQQSAMWQAMLMSAQLPQSHTIVINGFINGAGGIKMSKSLGNVVSPTEVVERYGTEALRYFVCRELSTFEDAEFTWERFHNAYNANLANGLGNLVSRVMTMAEKNLSESISVSEDSLPQGFVDAMERCEIGKACDVIWEKIGELDKKIQDSEPFKLVKVEPEKGKEIIKELVQGIHEVASMLLPILPETSAAIKTLVRENKKPVEPLFFEKMPKYFDIHSHLQASQFDGDREEVLARMRTDGVHTILVGTDLETSKQAIKLAESSNGLYACIGVHPVDDPSRVFEMEQFEALITHSKVVAVGECGLDFFRNDKSTDYERQKTLFLAQVEFALRFDKPLMIHSRAGYQELLELLEPLKKIHGDILRGDVHFFAGTLEEAQRFWNIGFATSFTGVVTFARNYDDVIKAAPIEMLMSETDAPYVAPIPYRGKRNEPGYVSEVVKKIAEIRGEDVEKTAEALVQNALRLFKILP